MSNYGKKFELKVKEDWEKMPDSLIIRIYDVTMGYKKIKNVSDFFAYQYPYCYLLEAKSVSGNTFNLNSLTQYEDLIKYDNIKGVNPAVLIWFIKHQKVCYVPIREIKRLKENDYKSVNIKMVEDSNYEVFELDGNVKRVFIDTNYERVKEIATVKYNKDKENENGK